jgi:hypothetical protein
MPRSFLMTQSPTLFSGALRSLLVGTPRIPTYPSTDMPSPLAKLFAVSVCGLQLRLRAELRCRPEGAGVKLSLNHPQQQENTK